MKYLRYINLFLVACLGWVEASASDAAVARQTEPTVVESATCSVCEDLLALTRKRHEVSAWESWLFQGDVWAAGYDGFGLGGVGMSLGRMVAEDQWMALHAGGAHGIGQLGWANVGLSWRQALSSQRWWGVNVFYDLLSTEGGSQYGQVGVGLEYGWRRWTLRGNAYLPVHGNMDDTDMSAGGVCAAWRGLDAEVQYDLFSKPRWIDGHLAAGLFVGETPVDNQSAAGARVRAHFSFGDHFYLQGEWRQNGHEIGLEWRMVAGLRFAFGKRQSAAAKPVHASASHAQAMCSAKNPQPVTSAKQVHAVQAMSSAKSAKSVQPLSVAKAPQPVFAPPPLAPTLLPAGMFQPVQRTPWPFVRRGGEPCECIEGDLEF